MAGAFDPGSLSAATVVRAAVTQADRVAWACYAGREGWGISGGEATALNKEKERQITYRSFSAIILYLSDSAIFTA